MSRERECEAENHEPDCPCVFCQREFCGRCNNTNVDHFTSKALAAEMAKMWPGDWTRKQADDPDNLQYLSKVCHKAKDRTAPVRISILRRMRRGEFISLAKYKSIIEGHEQPREERPPNRKRSVRKRSRHR